MGVCVLTSLLCHAEKWDSSVNIGTRLWAGSFGVILAEVRDFLFSKTSILDVGPTQPLIQYIFGVLSSNGMVTYISAVSTFICVKSLLPLT